MAADAFFVLSGFFITGVLAREYGATESIDVASFLGCEQVDDSRLDSSILSRLRHLPSKTNGSPAAPCTLPCS